jgi:hypothetical protein
MKPKLTAREYNCPTCSAAIGRPRNFHVYHDTPEEISQFCWGCGGPVTFVRFPEQIYCGTCYEPYSRDPTPRAALCSDAFHLCRDCKWEDGVLIEECAYHRNITPEEQELLMRFLTSKINETQFNFLINQNGFDKEKMYYLAGRAKAGATQLILMLSVCLVLGGVLLISWLLRGLFGF